jgi:opacity protein-like surface antigen
MMRSCLTAIVCAVALVTAAEAPDGVDAQKATSASADTAQVSTTPKNTKSALDEMTHIDPQRKKTWTKIKNLFL